MKYRIVILMLAGMLTISLAGCGNRTKNQNTAETEIGTELAESVTSDTENSDDTTAAVEESETECIAGTVSQDETDDATEKEIKKDETAQAAAESQTSVETETLVETETPVKTETSKETAPAKTERTVSIQTQVQTSTEAPKPEETKRDDVETEVPKTEVPKTEETPVSKPQATAADIKAVADKIVEYLNSYRNSPVTKLSGLTAYAEYRSRQIIGNFAHDTADERAAATALCYGTYIDPKIYGIEGTPYYTVDAREAIAKAGYTGTIDEVAESLAKLVKNSESHWKYVGNSEYAYIGVGVIYESGMWYCDIAVAAENTDNN